MITTTANSLTRQLFENGGFTLWTAYSNREHGYSVGNNNFSVVVDVRDLTSAQAHSEVRETLEDFFGYARILEARGETVDGIGGWYDTENCAVYLDVIRHCWELGDALEMAKRNGELAIYDIYRKEVITVC